MTDNPNGVAPLRLNPEQLSTMLLIENLLAQMQTAANQLGSFMKYEPGANAILRAQQVLGDDYNRMRDMWSKSVVIAPAAALSVIEGKAH